MKVTQHGNKYRIDYRCPNYPKLIHESFDSKEEAELRLAQIQLEKKWGTLLPPARLVDPAVDHALAGQTMTVAQLMQEYINLYGLSHWSEGTLSCNLHRIHDYILPYLGDIPIRALTTHRLEQFYRQLQNEPAVKTKGHEHEKKNISPSVIEKVHAILRSALNQAIRWDYLKGSNSAMAVELPKYQKGRREAWSEQESLKALALCEDPVLKLCMYLALGCSMRIGEILGLTWNCVHLDAQEGAFLYVEKELRRCNKKSLEQLKAQGRDAVFLVFPPWKKTESTTSLVLKTPKTESSVRRIYLPQAVIDILRYTREQQASLQADLGMEYQDFGLVVAQNNGRPYEEHIIAQKFSTLIAAHHLKPVVFHSLRHSSTSLKLKLSGGDIKAVQKDTGHSQARMVTDVYSHSFEEDRKQLAHQMDEQFFSKAKHPETEKAPDPPALDESMQKLIQALRASPEKAISLMMLLGLN